MRVILLQDVEKLGKKHEVLEVKEGYARNFLLAKGLAKIATKKTLEWLETQKEEKTKKDEEDLKKAQALASGLDGFELAIQVKLGEDGQLFESINKQKIFEKLKEAGFNIKKTQIVLEEPIKELGEFPVRLGLEHHLEAEIKIIVTPEKELKKEELEEE